MKSASANDQMHAYTEAVKSGLYAKRSGLVGKYDNVRKYWEDEITRMRLMPHLQKLVQRKESRLERLRILDLGCGSADGLELLSNIRLKEVDIHELEVRLLTPDRLGLYKGVDLNKDLLDQARSIYECDPKIVFEQGDFTNGLPIDDGEKPYDLYFSSYGTFSHHNDDDTAVKLLADIARRTENYSVIVCDWLGRYSYEWQDLWNGKLEDNRNMDYVVSYIYDEEERELRRDQLQHLNLRLMSRAEVEEVISRVRAISGVNIRVLEVFDRSVLTGRHMDTGDYNKNAKPIRKAVNSLHEADFRTDFDSLLSDYCPKAGFEFLNDYFEYVHMCWNALVRYTYCLLDAYDEDEAEFRKPLPSRPIACPAPLTEMMDRMKHVVEGVAWMGIGLPRENIIEPQLGYALRHLMMALQRGEGCGHGLVAILEVDKTSETKQMEQEHGDTNND